MGKKLSTQNESSRLREIHKIYRSKRYKARLVIRGFRQQEGIDYNADKIYSPVARSEAIKTTLSIIAERRLFTRQIDVKNAFLNSRLSDSPVFLIPPEGKDNSSGKVLKLLRGIYGLKQAPFEFCQTFKRIILKRGLTQSRTDPCIYFRNGGDLLIVCIYVDDGIVTGRSERTVLEFIDSLKSDLEITSQPLSYLLGIQIERNKNEDLRIHQTKYVDEILKRSNMANCRPVPTPCDATLYSIPDTGTSPMEGYRELIGSLLYLSTNCRPDIAFATAYLSRYLDRCILISPKNSVYKSTIKRRSD